MSFFNPCSSGDTESTDGVSLEIPSLPLQRVSVDFIGSPSKHNNAWLIVSAKIETHKHSGQLKNLNYAADIKITSLCKLFNEVN